MEISRAALLIALLAAGCAATHGRGAADDASTCEPIVESCNGADDDCDGSIDDGVDCGVARACVAGACTCAETTVPTDEVDLLLVIDDGPSMAEEQNQALLEVPRLVRALASGDREGDGTRDFVPPRVIRTAVVTGARGAAGYDVAGCTGERAALRATPGIAYPGCAVEYPEVQIFVAGMDPDEHAGDVACVAAVGASGCVVRQPLEAALEVLSPAAPTGWTGEVYAPPSFGGRAGLALDRDASAAIGSDSVLAILVLTDGDDCTARDRTLYDPESPARDPDLAARCALEPSALEALARYVRGDGGRAGLMGLRRRPGRVVLGAIVGMPVLDAPLSTPEAIEELLRDPRMAFERDPEGALVPACDVTGRARAVPARRILDAARSLALEGAHVAALSICQASYLPVVDAIAAAMGPETARCD